MTRVQAIVEEMRDMAANNATRKDRAFVASRLRQLADDLTAAHRADLEDALGPMTEAEEDAIDELIPANDNCAANWIGRLLASRRKRYIP